MPLPLTKYSISSSSRTNQVLYHLQENWSYGSGRGTTGSVSQLSAEVGDRWNWGWTETGSAVNLFVKGSRVLDSSIRWPNTSAFAITYRLL